MFLRMEIIATSAHWRDLTTSSHWSVTTGGNSTADLRTNRSWGRVSSSSWWITTGRRSCWRDLTTEILKLTDTRPEHSPVNVYLLDIILLLLPDEDLHTLAQHHDGPYFCVFKHQVFHKKADAVRINMFKNILFGDKIIEYNKLLIISSHLL